MSRRLIFGQRQLLVPWAARRMPFPMEFEDGANAIGVAVEDKLQCVCVYHNYYPEMADIGMSIASEAPTWASPEMFAALLSFPFLELDCERITSWQPASHPRARKLVEGVGFKVEGVKRRGFGAHGDAVMLGLLKVDAGRWLKRCPMGLYKAQRVEI